MSKPCSSGDATWITGNSGAISVPLPRAGPSMRGRSWIVAPDAAADQTHALATELLKLSSAGQWR